MVGEVVWPAAGDAQPSSSSTVTVTVNQRVREDDDAAFGLAAPLWRGIAGTCNEWNSTH